MNPFLSALLDDLRQQGFRDLAGARASASIPVARPLLNRIVADALRQKRGPVRDIDVRPMPGDRFELVVSLKWALVPPVTVMLTIDRQPAFPDSPILALRWSLPAGLGVIASQFVAAIKSLPEGVRLEADRIFVDLPRIAARGPAAELLPYVARCELHTTADAARCDIDLRIA